MGRIKTLRSGVRGQGPSNTAPPIAHIAPIELDLSARLLKYNGVSSRLLDQWHALNGTRNPASVTVATSVPLLAMARELWRLGVGQIAKTTNAAEVELQRFDFPFKENEALATDFRDIRSKILPQLRDWLPHSVIVLLPCLANGSLVTSAFAVGTGSPSLPDVGALAPVKRRRRSIVAPTSTERWPASEEQIESLAQLIWSPSALNQMRRDWTPLSGKPSRSDAQMELRCQAARALIQLPYCMFGVGMGKQLIRGIGRTIKARATLLDIGSTSPLKTEGIQVLLASLPEDKCGTPLRLPAIRAL